MKIKYKIHSPVFYNQLIHSTGLYTKEGNNRESLIDCKDRRTEWIYTTFSLGTITFLPLTLLIDPYTKPGNNGHLVRKERSMIRWPIITTFCIGDHQ